MNSCPSPAVQWRALPRRWEQRQPRRRAAWPSQSATLLPAGLPQRPYRRLGRRLAPARVRLFPGRHDHAGDHGPGHPPPDSWLASLRKAVLRRRVAPPGLAALRVPQAPDDPQRWPGRGAPVAAWLRLRLKSPFPPRPLWRWIRPENFPAIPCRNKQVATGEERLPRSPGDRSFCGALSARASICACLACNTKTAPGAMRQGTWEPRATAAGVHFREKSRAAYNAICPVRFQRQFAVINTFLS
jgi:hypothetical protein